MPPAATASTEVRAAFASLRAHFAQAAFFSVVVNVLVLAPVFYMLQVYGRVVFSRNVDTLAMLTVLVVGLIALMEFVDWVRLRIMDAAAVGLDRRLAVRIFDATFDAQLRGIAVGATPLADLRALRGFLGSPACIALVDAPMALVCTAIVFAVSPLLGGIVLGSAAMMLAFGYASERATRPPLDAAQKFAGEAQRYAAMALKNAQVIHAMGMVEDIRDRWLARQRMFLARQAAAADSAATGAAVAKFILLAQSSVVLGFACWLVLQGEMALGGGGLVIAWTLSGRALGPLQKLIAQWRSVIGARAACDRLARFLAGVGARTHGMPLPAPAGALSVEGVVAGAPNSSATILRGITFALAPGTILAVVGPTASGKSTLARLLVGLWPAAAGKVRLDSVDVHAWNKEELGPSVGYVPQDVELFEGTLAENIARFADVDPEKVEAAARAVGLHDDIVQLPAGYDTPIGMDGSRLSGGQRQRVALARALYGAPSFIVLDEPNSSLDEPGNRALQDALALQRARGATVVIVTHRMNVLAVADRILVLRNGRIDKFGPRDDVLAAIAGKPRPAVAPAPALAGNAGASG